jgi:TPP-dependent pyruvate/acetoin dehydrogenase alpha subunit
MSIRTVDEPREPILDLEVATRNILRLRYWQHIINEFLKQRRFKIPIHLAFGHEAVAVALSSITKSDDSVCVTHRNVAYNLARQPTLQPVLDLYDLAVSTDQADMGSMNLALSDNGVIYASSILGNNLAVAAGIAMNRKLCNRDGVSFAITGDGAIEEGIFWEVLLHARTHNLPLVIMVEDNDFSLASTISERRCQIDLRLVCKAIGLDFQQVDGANYLELARVLHSARNTASDGQPVCISTRVKTFCQHAGPTPGWPGDSMNIDISNGMILEDDLQDPLFNIKQLIGENIYKELEDDVRNNERFH